MTREKLTIDGATGEGGGQILRTALALSVCLDRPFQMHHIRAARKRPGLQPQHLAAVRAAACISRAQVEGAEKDSQQLTFTPGRVTPGSYEFDIGTAGSTTLLLQAVLPPLLLADAPSHIVLKGGTHNPMAPPYDFLVHAFLPLLHRMGAKVSAHLVRPGFYPTGGGIIEVDVEPAAALEPLVLEERGAIVTQRAEAILARLPDHIGQRELRTLAKGLDLPAESLEVKHVDASSPGNTLAVSIESEHVTEVFTGFGERGVRAETVAMRLTHEVEHYLKAGVPVGEHLADQLLLPLALAGGGVFVTMEPTLHATTNMAVIRKFMEVKFESEQIGDNQWRIGVVNGKQ